MTIIKDNDLLNQILFNSLLNPTLAKYSYVL